MFFGKNKSQDKVVKVTDRQYKELISNMNRKERKDFERKQKEYELKQEERRREREESLFDAWLFVEDMLDDD